MELCEVEGLALSISELEGDRLYSDGEGYVEAVCSSGITVLVELLGAVDGTVVLREDGWIKGFINNGFIL